jgi:hypothetical protein
MSELSNADRDRILARVKKMLNLANDTGASEGERENAMRMAHATLAKYNLSLNEATAEADPRGKHTAVMFSRPWSRQVANAVAKLFFCTYSYTPPKEQRVGKHYFIGKATNALAAEAMARYLIDGIQKESWAQARARGQDSTFARAFCLGAALAINARVVEMMKKPPADSAPGTALVLVDYYKQELVANEDWMKKNMQLKDANTRFRAGSGDGLYAGKAYGNRVDLTARDLNAQRLK